MTQTASVRAHARPRRAPFYPEAHENNSRVKRASYRAIAPSKRVAALPSAGAPKVVKEAAQKAAR